MTQTSIGHTAGHDKTPTYNSVYVLLIMMLFMNMQCRARRHTGCVSELHAGSVFVPDASVVTVQQLHSRMTAMSNHSKIPTLALRVKC